MEKAKDNSLKFVVLVAGVAAISGCPSPNTPDTGVGMDVVMPPADTGTSSDVQMGGDSASTDAAAHDATTATDVVQTDVGTDGSIGGNPLIGTWVYHPAAIPAGSGQAMDNLTSITYTVTFNADMSWSATLQRQFGAAGNSAGNFAGCTENWVLNGYSYTVNNSSVPPTFSISMGTAATETVMRSGCTTPGDNQAAMADTGLNNNVNNGSSEFTITGTGPGAMMALTNTQSGVPYDSDAYLFIKQ